MRAIKEAEAQEDAAPPASSNPEIGPQTDEAVIAKAEIAKDDQESQSASELTQKEPPDVRIPLSAMDFDQDTLPFEPPSEEE